MHKQYTSLRRRPFLTPVWLMALAGLLAIGVVVWLVCSATTTTIMVMRHGEKAAVPADDPGLSHEGEARAERLAEVLGRAPEGQRIEVIFTSELRRTQDMARPLASRLGVPVISMPAGDPGALVERLLDEYRGGRILVVGHSNTVPEIVRRLGGEDIPDMADTEFGVIYVVTRPRFGRTSVIRLDLS